MKKFKFVLPNNEKTKKFLETLPKLYMVGCWVHFGVREFRFTGTNTESGIPMVYDYYDGNGTCDEYHLIPLTHTTTGWIYCWTTSKSRAEEIACALNTSGKNN